MNVVKLNVIMPSVVGKNVAAPKLHLQQIWSQFYNLVMINGKKSLYRVTI